ncbi:MAG TPA: LysM peptidoglycan-binding domain-containing protein [Candidatus Acidoferrum sp.]|nr:LysM peptidoglycan-binding domain-containing protein [Candidatus Acidoferrum sp.]
MTSPDLDALARVSCLTAAKSSFGSLRSCLPAILISSFVLFGSAQCRAQDQAQDQTQNQKDQNVADAARQERARKESQQKRPKHVYTADDLKREHILTPEDRAQLEARKNQQPNAPTNAQQPQDAVGGSALAQEVNNTAVKPDADPALPSTNSTNVPLGDVARRFRKEKQSQQLQRSAEFHLPFADAPVLASPKAPAQPLVPPAVTVDPSTVVHPAPRVVAPLRPFVKRSPFERPRVLPAPVVSTPRTIVPEPFAPRVVPEPLAHRVSSLPAISGKLTIVTVKPGDTLWKFAASRLGNGRRWQELLVLNPGLRNPDVLQVGSEIVVPSSLVPPRAPTKYTVRHGDTLWTIAEAQLHRGSAWSCIAHTNPELTDANLIREGQVLLLPSSCLPSGSQPLP